jgi:general secretion pathway protein N
VRIASEICGLLRSHVAGRCGLLALVLLAITFNHSRASVLAATGPADSGAVETPIEPPFALRSPAIAPPSAASAGLPAGNPLWAVPLRMLNVTRERPLFSPSRRPPPAAVAAAPSAALARRTTRPAAPDHPLLTLVGTIVGRHQGIGIFVDQTSKNTISLKTGQDHDGWTLREVRDRETVFERHQREVVLALPARNVVTPAIQAVDATALPAGTWMDGDGRTISPPPSALNGGSEKSITSSVANWRDGDGQLITPPTAK